MNLEVIFEHQERLQLDMGDPMGSGVSGVKENMLAMIVEIVEVLNELDWKAWKDGRPPDKEKVTEELVDVLQFYANICNLLNITPSMLEKAYKVKLGINYERIKQRKCGDKA